MSSHYEKLTKRLNGARSGKSASVSIILAKPFFNTQQEAQEPLRPKLKLENYDIVSTLEQSNISKGAAVIEEYLKFVYEKKNREIFSL